MDEGPDGLRLISDIIHEKLGIEMTVLMGANIASEVAEEKFCETTIGKEPTSPSLAAFICDEQEEGKGGIQCSSNSCCPVPWEDRRLHGSWLSPFPGFVMGSLASLTTELCS